MAGREVHYKWRFIVFFLINGKCSRQTRFDDTILGGLQEKQKDPDF